MKIVIASDHAGYFLKEKIKDFLQREGYEVIDVGCHSSVAVDYPEFGIKAVEKILKKEADYGILICGTGVGMSLSANKVDGIRSVVCSEPYSARMAREHNNANILSLGARFMSQEEIYDVIETWLEEPFEGGRHQRRIEKLDK